MQDRDVEDRNAQDRNAQDRDAQGTGQDGGGLPAIAEVRAAMTAPGQLFEMAETEIRGVRTRVWKNAPVTLRDILEISRAHGDKDYLVYGGDRLTFADHYARAAAFARRSSTGTGSPRATGSRSPCATTPNGRWRSSAPPQRARWWCR
ncbi:hypothetical protein LUX57_04095 [Actinomadura madurae]|uniref:hypothetical protein n=1 Tax=Actinomadura madurae TaxID=1993 RepID=UPI0020D21E09|nr:hypothetical protein [Actinomadura madurae]MCP9964448.1 hypothetical protein [Actinomadura madurae]